MNPHRSNSLHFITLFILTVSAARADVKVRVKHNVGAQASEGTILTKGLRQRFEFGAGLAVIEQNDSKRVIHVNDTTRTYLTLPLEGDNVSGTPEGGVVTITTTSTDTAERKEAFGYTARLIKSSITKEPSPDACDQERQRIETEGWYIDLEESSIHPGERFGASKSHESASGACADKIRYRQLGNGKLGYPVAYTTTIYGEDDRNSVSMTMEVVELTTAQIDPSLFDIPRDYTEAKQYLDIARLYSSDSRSLRELTRRPPPPVTPKKPGTIRVGIVAVANKTEWPLSTESLDQQLMQWIVKAKIHAVRLEASSAPAVDSEARGKSCDYLLYTDLAELKSTSRGSKTDIAAIYGYMPGLGEKFQARVEFRLLTPGSTTAELTSQSVGKTRGGSSWKRTMLQLAFSAGTMALMAKSGSSRPGKLSLLAALSAIGGSVSDVDTLNLWTMASRAGVHPRLMSLYTMLSGMGGQYSIEGVNASGVFPGMIPHFGGQHPGLLGGNSGVPAALSALLRASSPDVWGGPVPQGVYDGGALSDALEREARAVAAHVRKKR